jgi:serine/threonine protein kinase
MMKRIVLAIVIGLLSLLFLISPLSSIPAKAAAIWGSDASGELSGSRTSLIGGGIDATVDDWDNGGFTVEWTISEEEGEWTYVYSITATVKAISHFVLEVSDDGKPFNTFVGTDAFEGPETWSQTKSNPSMPNDIYGVKFDFGGNQVNYTIVTDRAPVYGVFYAKDGKDDDSKDSVEAWSNALNFAEYKTTDTLTSTDFVVRPNGIVPIPTTLLLLGSGLIGVIGLRRRKVG